MSVTYIADINPNYCHKACEKENKNLVDLWMTWLKGFQDKNGKNGVTGWIEVISQLIYCHIKHRILTVSRSQKSYLRCLSEVKSTVCIINQI